MITARSFTGLLFLLMASAFWGCTDHQFQGVTPGVNRLRVKTITRQVPDNPSVSTISAFAYDGQGRLSSIMAYQLPDSTVAPVENTTYQYNAQNRPTQVQHAMVRRGSATETYTLTYNSAGQLVILTNSTSTFSLSLQYNASNLVSSYGKSISVGGLQSSGGGSLTFIGNNVTAASENFAVFRSGGSPSAPAVYGRQISNTYTYDDKVNPFYGIYIIPAPGFFHGFAGTGSFGPFYTLYGGTDNLFNLSRNNVQSVVNSGGTTTYSYTYNAANLPTSRTTTTTSGVTEILRYEYESY